MPINYQRYALLTEQSGRQLIDQRRRIEKIPLVQQRTPTGLLASEGLYARITVNHLDGTYDGEQVERNSTAWDTTSGGVVWDATAGGPGYLIAADSAASYETGTIVHAWAWGDIDGTTVWIFDSYQDDITKLCYGTWDITWDVSSGAGAIDGELNITSGYTYIYVHRIDTDGAWRAPWLQQFKVGDIVKIATETSGVGCLFEIVGSTLTGDYYTFEIDICDISNKALILDDSEVQVCIGLVCTLPGDVEIEEGPGIGVVENPNDHFKISCLLEEGTCISLTEQGDGNPTIIAVDLGCIGLSIDWSSYISVCDSIEWKDSPDNCIHLVGDESTPPDYTLYAYLDSLAPHGWHYLNDMIADTDTIRKTSATGLELDLEVAYQMSITADASGLLLDGDEESPADYSVYCKTTGNKGWDGLLNFFVNTSTISWSGGSPSQLQAAIEFTANSSVVDNGGVELYADESAPGSHHYYGTNYTDGAKGWNAFTSITVVTDVQLDGSFDLQKKTRVVYVVDPASESVWTTISGWTTSDCVTPS